MCGIAGIYDIKKSVEVDDLKKMSSSLEHRGPDGCGHWVDKSQNCGLSHRRLAIIDLSAEAAQPMHYFDRYVITYNGEIYNYIEVRDKLRTFGLRFQTSSDVEVVLAAYHHFGKDCLQHLDGMFAFAIYDRSNGKLFCARDRFGEKPFYYKADQFSFVFGSEMKALWSVGVKKVVSEAGIYQYLVHNRFIPSAPFYEGIEELAPGHFMEIIKTDIGLSVRTNQYFDIQQVEEIPIDQKGIRDLLESSIISRSISDVGFCTSMSGGIDSAIVTAICKQQKQDLQSFGIGFPLSKDDETKNQEILALHLEVLHHNKATTPKELSDRLHKVVYHQELPITGMSVCAQNILYQFVRESGHKVLLEGQGADEIFGGYNYHHKAHIFDLYKERKIGAAITHSALHLWNNKGKLATKLGETSMGEIPVKQEFMQIYAPENPNQNESDFENGSFQTLLRYADRNAMMYGLEVRQPFLQADVVKAGLSIPPASKFKNGYKKYLLRKAFEQELPGKILWQREKIGFATPWPTKEMMLKMVDGNTTADAYFDIINPLDLKWQFKKMMLNMIL